MNHTFKHRSVKSLSAKFALGLCLLSSLGLTGSLTSARAADAVTVGVLDETKLGKGYTKYQNEMAENEKRVDVYQAQLNSRRALNDVEGKRFDVLVKTRTAAEEGEFQTLVKTGTDRMKAATDLSGQAQRTPEQEAKLKEIQGYMKVNDSAALYLEDYFTGLLRTQDDTTTKKYLDVADEMVKKVAVDKKLTLVLRKDAVVWYATAVDITDEVLSRLNK